MALSFVIPTDQFGKHKPTSLKTTEHDEKILAKILRQQAKLNRKVEPYNFSKSQMEAFRYRMNDGTFPTAPVLMIYILTYLHSTESRHQGSYPGSKNKGAEAGAAQERDAQAVSFPW